MINELDEAELRYECREMYNDTGFEGCMDALTETLKFGQIMMEVLYEEYRKTKADEHL